MSRQSVDVTKRDLAPGTQDANVLPDRPAIRVWFQAAEQATDRRLGAVNNTDSHYENRQWVSGGWCAS